MNESWATHAFGACFAYERCAWCEIEAMQLTPAGADKLEA